jgi:hypothetical protein
MKNTRQRGSLRAALTPEITTVTAMRDSGIILAYRESIFG